MTYRPDIDGIRAIAILLVTVFHFDLFAIGKAGFIGVDVFFVLSGFLITSIILRDLATHQFHFGTFLYHRVRRLYPALLATTILFLIAGYLLLLPHRFEELAWETVLTQLYVVNFYFWQSVDYFGLRASDVPLLHMWSLAVEEQFYLIFPLVCLLIWKWRPGWLLGATIVAIVLSFALGYVLSPVKPSAAFYLLFTRGWELLAGCVLAMILVRRSEPVPHAGMLGPVGIALILVAVFIHTPGTVVPGAYALLPVLASVCLLLSGTVSTAFVTRILSTPVMVWVGLISYPLYLVHWPILYLLRQSLEDFTLPWRVFGFALSFVVAWVIWAAIEKPIRSRRILKGRTQYLSVAGGISVIAIVASLAIVWQNGLPGRFDPQVSAALSFKDDGAKIYRHCQNTVAGTVPESCVLGAKNTSPRFLVIGDSHANAFARSIHLWLEEREESAVFSFSPGCMPVRSMGSRRCREHFSSALAFAQNNPDVDTVLMSSIWRQPYEGGMLHEGTWKGPTEIEDAFATELLASVEAFQQADKTVILVDPFFAAPRPVAVTLANNLAFDRDWPVDTPLAEHKATFAHLFDTFETAEKAGAHRISLIAPFCDETTCFGVFEGRPVFSDNNHVADSQSSLIAEQFLKGFDALSLP